MSTHTYSFLRARGGGKSQTLHWTGVLGYLLCLGTLVLGCLSTWLPGYLSTFEYRNMCCFLRAKGGGNVLLKYYFHLRAFVQWAEKPRLAGTWLKLSAVVLVLVGWKKVQSRWQWLREETQWLGGSQADHGSPWCNRELLPVQTPQIAFFLWIYFIVVLIFPLDDWMILKYWKKLSHVFSVLTDISETFLKPALLTVHWDSHWEVFSHVYCVPLILCI